MEINVKWHKIQSNGEFNLRKIAQNGLVINKQCGLELSSYALEQNCSIMLLEIYHSAELCSIPALAHLPVIFK